MRRIEVDVFNFADKVRILKIAKKTISYLKKKFNHLDRINIVFVSDSEITKLNKKFLKRNRPTDVIAFVPSSNRTWINEKHSEKKTGEIFISTERARVNAEKFDVNFKNEIARLIIHGLLHVGGFRDKSLKEKKRMWNKQEEILKCLL